MVFSRKTLQLVFLVRTETFNWSLEKNEGDLVCFNHSGVLSPSVLKVISSDYVSVHPGLGVMAGVECFPAVCSAVWLPMHRASVSSSCWFSLRKGAIHTNGKIKNWQERNQTWNSLGTIFVKSSTVAVSAFKLFITLQICQTCQQVSNEFPPRGIMENFE